MALDIVLNDLSFTPAENVLSARSRMSGLVQTIKSARLQGMRGSLRTQRDFRYVILAEGYPVERWIYDCASNPDEGRFFLTLATKEPYLRDRVILQDKFRGMECQFCGCVAEGLGSAHLLDTMAVSRASDPIWDAWVLQLRCEELTEDVGISCTDEEIRHASTPAHVIANTAWIQGRLRTDVKIGRELWERREELFPSLQFCDGVQPQLERLTPALILPVTRHLLAFEAYCRDWKVGGFNPDAIPLNKSTESKPTLEQYGAERTFLCPDGIQRLFSWHSKGNPGAFRIYFAPVKPGELIIGYIGRHLRIVSTN
jgi:hypothetical protein